MPTPIIEVQSLTSRYGAFTAVDDLSFHVNPGELYALLGTNGAGKTTTLETIEGHRSPSNGKVSVFGGSPDDRTSTRPRVGMMLQESGFAGDLTAEETVNLIGRLSGRTDDTARLLERVDLTRKSTVRVAQLSGGEKRRLDFATAIYGTPELVFLDEPTNALDPAARDALWRVVDELRGQGSTILLTTHYLEEAEAHADRIGLMHRGRLAHEGSLAELVAAFPARITFETDLLSPDMPVAPASVTGDRVVIETHELQRDLYQVLGWADANAIHLRSLSATTSSLADVFRTLTDDPEVTP
ncbi:ABC transporter ATP-binding protein [Microbacterium lacticum]|uniref:ABC-2 type transport system ATP-binding protein n=1 Tax=Microbacterium lacticum TaxID=33885 RepID=A0A4Y3USZ3_9MICO|nr:ABC transporter ATP-binding protein [Microbacterium lacticum]TQM98246.1 ABC-2 type transport system ATP-binding protein [Microbacterium lacticum]GEB95955.1 multidrug ABC transporter ATP-binding protein [Microbacterium lacticum]GGI70960.1 multidrug ABC transporter ATP-binding protein [Microbacterium lacticum]